MAENVIGPFGRGKTLNILFPVWEGIKISGVPDQNAGYSTYPRPIGLTSQDMNLTIFIFDKLHRWLLYFKKRFDNY